MKRAILILVCLLPLGGLGGVIILRNAITQRAPDPGPPTVQLPKAAPIDAEPTQEDCSNAVKKARALAEALPVGDLSRYFAERSLQQSMAEAGNGEFDDCLYWAERATEEVQEHRHILQPGETLKVLRADEQPAPQESAPAAQEPAPAAPPEKRASHQKSRHSKHP